MTRIVLNSSAASGHIPNHRTPTPATDSVIGSGCSSTDPIWWGGTGTTNGLTFHARQAKGASTGYDCVKSTIPGSSMIWRKDHVAIPVNAWDVAGDYDLLFIGDNPDNNTQNDFGVLMEWVEKMWATGGEAILWSPYTYFIEDITAMQAQTNKHMAVHEAWMDYANARRPNGAKKVRICPATLAFQAIHDDTQAGLTPSSASFIEPEFPKTGNFIKDMYRYRSDNGQLDDIHVRAEGGYLCRMMSAAYIWGIDPMLSTNQWTATETINAEVAKYLKRKASDAIKGYARSGIDTSGWL